MSPFDFIKNINEGSRGKNLLEGCTAHKDTHQPDALDKQYDPFMVNRGLSYFMDTVLCANEMNMLYHLSNKEQYDFLRHSIRPKKRFSKWNKKQKLAEDIKLIQEAYGYSKEKAEKIIDLFSKEDIQTLKKSLDKGGT